MKKNNGFTLVELAIVMMIVGLMIGGVLKGAEMAQNARVKAVIKEVNSVNGSIAAFMDKYSGVMPGDIATATARIPNCTNANSCFSGTGDNIIGDRVHIWTGGQQAVNTENTQFWKHLLLSDFISDISGSTTIAWGESHPAARIGGGYTVVSAAFAATNGGAGQASPDGLHLRLHASLTAEDIETSTGDGTWNSPGDMPVSPSEAYYIDKTMDDGVPGTGYVRSYVYGNPTGPGCENQYDAQNKSKDCAMAFRLLGNK